MRLFDRRSKERRSARPRVTSVFVAQVLLLALYLVSRPSDCASGRGAPLVVDFEGCDVVRASQGDGGVACTFAKLSIHDFPKLSREQIRARCGDGPPLPRRMTFWARDVAAARVLADGVDVTTSPVSVGPDDHVSDQEGVRLSVEVSAVTREITVSSEGRAPFRLTIVPEEFPPSKSGLYDAICGWKEDRGKTAARLEAFARDPDPAVRAKANTLIARSERARRDPRAIQRFEEAERDAEKAGLLSDAAVTSFVLANALIEDRRFTRAEQVLDRIRPLVDRIPVIAAIEPYFRAIGCLAVGDLHGARKQLEASQRRAWRLDLNGHLSDVYERMMEVLELLGQHGDARLYGDKLDEAARLSHYGPCQSAQYAENVGWYELLEGRHPEQAREHLELARDGFSETTRSGEPGCNNVAELANVLLNLAHVAMELGRLDEAEERLSAATEAEALIARRGGSDARVRALHANLEGRLALERGDMNGALAGYTDAAEVAARERLPYAGVTASFGVAQAHELLGDRDRALDAYRAADDQLNRWSTLVPFGGGKQRFLGRHDAGMLRYLKLLVDSGELETAACVARRDRSRIPALVEWMHLLDVAPRERRDGWLAALEGASAPRGEVEAGLLLERAAAEVVGASLTPSSCDAGVSAPTADVDAGEAMLVYHPLERPRAHEKTQWVGFAIVQGGVTKHFIDVDPAWLRRDANITGSAARMKEVGHALLDPFADVLGALERSRTGGPAPRVRLLSAESMAFLPIHRLPLEGRPLEERFSAVYSVDLPAREAAQAPTWTPKRALVVASPGKNLRETHAEAKRVEDDLRARGWDVLVLEGASATRERVLAELPTRELLHYAGHGHARGHDGWDDWLELPRGQSLGVQDILSLRGAPRFVTLAACEGAAAGEDAPTPQGMSLAHAFIAVGSEIVVAARWKVGDATTEDVMSGLYAPSTALLEDPLAALRNASKALPDREGADFRVLTR